MSLPASRKAIASAFNVSRGQRGVSSVTIAVVLAAVAVVTLTIVQAAISGDTSVSNSGIPTLIG